MAILKLRGEPVTNLLLFRRYFDPCGLVCQRNLFYDFARGHLCLSRTEKYHTAILHALLTDGVGTGDFKAADSAEQRMEALYGINGDTYWENPLQLTENGFPVDMSDSAAEGGWERTAALYHWCAQHLPETERQPLFLLLCACYLLADASVADMSGLDAEKLLEAFGGNGARTGAGGRTLSLPQDDGRNVCAVRLERGMYFGVGRRGSLENGQRIKTYRLDNPYPSTDIILRLNNQTYTIPGGGCRYVNAVDGEIVRVLPEEAEDGGPRISRDDGQLILWNGAYNRALETGENVSSFAVGKEINETLYIRNYRLHTEYYDGWKQSREFASRRIVEVRFVNGDYFLLQDTGRVYSSNDAWNYQRGFTSLEDIL